MNSTLKYNVLWSAVLLFALTTNTTVAQDVKSDPVIFGAFVDTYYGHDFNDIESDRSYTTQALHDDEFSLNLGMGEAKLSTEKLRGRLAIQHGTSVESNYASEEHLFWRYIQESSLGVKITDKLWFDAGIYLAHIGFESFNSRDNWNYTRSLVAEYSPYYETGSKLTYQFDEATTGQLHILRGWQNISSDADPALGIQFAHTFPSNIQLTYNNFIGDVDGQRIFHDFIGKVDLTDDWSVALQVDVGSQKRSIEDDTAWWHGWSLMSQYKVAPKVAIGGRVERYSDPHQVVFTTINGPSFDAVGLSANVDVELFPRLFWRTEYRVLLGQDPVFPEKDNFSKNDSLVVTSLSFSL